MNTYLLLAIVVILLLAVAIVAVAILLRKSKVTDKKPLQPDEITNGLSQAFAALKAKLARPGLAQQLPWVLLLGERDSGKSSVIEALETAADDSPTTPGGLHWRLLDKGALMEVPGEYLLTPEGKPQSDGRWSRLLRQLVRHRPRSPLNGIVLAISADHLLSCDESTGAKRRAVAVAIRSKLDDLQRITGLVVPVHVLVTKCDQIRGFGAFCWETNPELRDGIFGWTNPNTLESAFVPTWVDDAFAMLQRSLVQRLTWVFGTRSAGVQAEELAILPLEFDTLRVPLRSFLTEIFHETAYVDSNFFRGIFFCGDATALRSLSPSPAMVDKRLPGTLAKAGANDAKDPVAIARANRRLYFLRDLFDFRVFVETRIARPVLHVRFARQRAVLATQLAIAAFAVIFSIGTARAWMRLSNLRDHRFIGLLNAISDTVPQAGKQTSPTVQTAYDLIDTLGTMHASGFYSLFLPESWGDPMNNRIASSLSDAYGRIVLPALSDALDKKGRDLLGSCQAETVAPDTSDADAAPALTSVDFRKDSQYVALDTFVHRYTDWQEAVRHYDTLRRFGTGSYTDLDALFAYLIGKNMRSADDINSSPYYQRALQGATGYQIPVTAGFDQDGCARRLSVALVNDFYTSWFDSNPLRKSTDDVASGIDDLENGKVQQLEQADALAQDIRDLDGQVTGGNMQWLTEAEFDPATYPAVQQLTALRFVNSDTLTQIKNSGNQELAKLKNTLFTTGSTLSGTVLQQTGTEVRVSGNAIALEVGLASLLHQDFAGTFTSANKATDKLIVWNTAALSQATTLRDSYDKFVHTQLPLLPPSMQGPVKQLAAVSVNQAVLSAVENAEEPQQAINDTTALMVIRSFNQAAPVLSNLESTLPGGSANPGGGFQLILTHESVALAKWLNDQLAAEPFYASQTVTPNAEQTDTPMAYLLFGVDSQDGLDDFLASQRERVKGLVQDYAAPLAGYLKEQGLQHVAQFDTWAGITRDVRDYDAKKPGNPIAALESFVHSDLDKISPEDGCRAVHAGSVSGDYFNQMRAQLQQTALQTCSQVALNDYQTEIASVFNGKLAGKFPFGNYPAQPGAAEADPRDVADFLTRVGKYGPALQKFFAGSAQYPDELAFVKACLGVKQMLAATDGESTPASDLVVYFRVDQPAEKGGNEIIDWNFEAGDNAVHYPGTETALRWHSGDPLELSLRYAKDSPEVPVPAPTAGGEVVDGRTVTWKYGGNWSLFALLNQHPGLASEFNTTPEMLRSTVRLVIPVAPDTSQLNKKVAPISTAETDTKVFLRIGLRVPDAKAPREVPVVPFPVQAPALPVQMAKD